ncbi:hypothetical protein Leryth_019927 [Lithospermum erythrorhizon]|nr:hypothetical protein Leryth_019927 [Lithospermum erythrorhizon]
MLSLIANPSFFLLQNPIPHLNCSFDPINYPKLYTRKRVVEYQKVVNTQLYICKKVVNFDCFDLKSSEFVENPIPHLSCFVYPINYPKLDTRKRVVNYPKVATTKLLFCKKVVNFGSFDLKRSEFKESLMSTRCTVQVYVGKKGGNFGCFDLKRSEVRENLMCSRCMSEGDRELEEKILEFMEKSEKPNRFPTKKELMNAGRIDLVEEIQERGGWFSLGWEDMESAVGEVGRVEESEIVAMEYDMEQFKRRQEGFGGSDVRASYPGVESAQSLPSLSSSGRSLITTSEEESGVEGILSRLQRERNHSLGIDMGINGRGPQTSSMDEGDHWNFQTSTSADRIDTGRNGSVMSGGSKKSASSDTNSYHNHYTKPDSWKVWSIQRAGCEISDFEAAEFSYKNVENEKAPSNSDDVAASKSLSGVKETNQDKIQTRLNQLESELSSALHSLRAVKEGTLIKGKDSSSNELKKLYDAWEFQENEVMHTKEKLRVIRAKLAIIEGKSSIMIGEWKNMEMFNQRRLEGARKALRLLRTTTIVWHNSASEVLLAGSYDGWTSQRKMEKSTSGIFCTSLRLYPGRYEIKFIVDGIWRVDPLLPVVHNNGHDNNLLIIT